MPRLGGLGRLTPQCAGCPVAGGQPCHVDDVLDRDAQPGQRPCLGGVCARRTAWWFARDQPACSECVRHRPSRASCPHWTSFWGAERRFVLRPSGLSWLLIGEVCGHVEPATHPRGVPVSLLGAGRRTCLLYTY